MYHKQSLRSNVIYEGIIYKKGAINKSWKERWFVLYSSRKLAYFDSRKSAECIKEIDLCNVQLLHVISNTNNSKKTKNKKSLTSNYNSTKNLSNNNFKTRNTSYSMSTIPKSS